MEKQSKSYQYCLDILQLGVRNNKALAKTVMALAANTQANSPAELINHPLFHYQNTSVSKSIAGLAPTPESWSSTELNIRYLVQLYLSRQMMEQPVLHLQTDTIPLRHPHSPALEDKTYIYVPNNVVPGNKPLSVGYQVSAVHIGEAQSHWSLPLSMRRVRTDQSAMECTMEQMDQRCRHRLCLSGFCGPLVPARTCQRRTGIGAYHQNRRCPAHPPAAMER